MYVVLQQAGIGFWSIQLDCEVIKSPCIQWKKIACALLRAMQLIDKVFFVGLQERSPEECQHQVDAR